MSVSAEQDSQSGEIETPERPGQSNLLTRSEEETVRLGAVLGDVLEPGDVVLLEGDLGVGKTAFTQGIGRGLNVSTTINSPTFTILKEYTGRTSLYHFDFYRIEEPEEVWMLGFDEYLGGDGVCVVEWAERGEGGGLAPWPAGGYLRLRMRRRNGNERCVAISAAGERGRILLEAFTRAAVGERCQRDGVE